MDMRLMVAAGTALAALLTGAADKAAAKPVAAQAQREKVAKHWKMMPVVPEEAASWGDGALAGNPELKSGAGPALALPKTDESLWGRWSFWNGQWWAQAMLLPEARGPSWEAPKAGFREPWTRYRNVWLKADMEVPAAWRGSRLAYEQNDIKDADLALWVNRQYCGVVRRPGGRVDVTKAMRPGEKNEFLVLLTANGWQIPKSNDPAAGAYNPRGGTQNFKFTKDPPFICALPPVCIEDVFANTSWRKKTLTMETDITVDRACKAELTGEVYDADGKLVKRLKEACELKAGLNTVSPSVKWENPVTWELGRGYLYTLKAKLSIGGKAYSYRDVKFGFREIWRDGRKIFMNGHEQKYRVSYNFGCNGLGAKFLQGVGYNCIQYAHVTNLDPQMNEADLELLSKEGIACIIPTAAFDWNTKNRYVNPGAARDEFAAIQAKNLRRYRNWPCVAMVYMGVNCYLPQWAYEAVHLGSGDGSQFAKMMDDLVAKAKKTNPNVLYFSHSDGNTGEIASANLYLNWVPLQEREEWPSRWAMRGHFPFQACEFGHPYQYSWYKDDRDLVTEYCAAYFGEEAYRDEPAEIQDRHLQGLYIRRILHPSFWKLTDEFCWRTTRAWRTFGVNAGIVWFNLDYGYGMPGWKYPAVWNQYSPAYNFFKTEADVPKGKPEWAFPSWDIYRKGNLDFLGWVAGWPRITDRRHAYYPGEKVEKQTVMMWDRFDARTFTATWVATVGGKKLTGGAFTRKLVSNQPVFDRISFAAPKVDRKTAGEIRVTFANEKGKEVFVDTAAFEVFPRPAVKWEKAPSFALYDPEGKAEVELKKLGLSAMTKVTSPAEAASATHLVVGQFALGKDGWNGLPMEAVEKQGLKILVLPQTAETWKAFGFNVQDRMSRILFVRDNASAAISKLDDDCVREWSGAPYTRQKDRWGLQQYGSLTGHPKHEPRWTYNMAVAALQLRSPDMAGWTPQVEGELDMNFSALAKYRCGKGSVQFCTLDFLSRVDTGSREDDTPRPATDAAVERTANAVLADFLLVKDEPADRMVVADGAEALKIAQTVRARVSGKAKADRGEVLLVGRDSKLGSADVLAAAKAGANVLVVANDAVAKGLGFALSPCGTNVFWVAFDHSNRDMRGIGQSQLHWRARMRYSVLGGAPKGWKIDAEGMFASAKVGDGRVFVTSFDPFYLERKVATDKEYGIRGQPPQLIADKDRARNAKRCDLSFERSRQFVARLLTNLGASSDASTSLYSGLVSGADPYEFVYW